MKEITELKQHEHWGWKYIPIELRYFSGGEKSNGAFSSENVKKFDTMAITNGYKPGNSFQGKIA